MVESVWTGLIRLQTLFDNIGIVGAHNCLLARIARSWSNSVVRSSAPPNTVLVTRHALARLVVLGVWALLDAVWAVPNVETLTAVVGAL